MYSGIEKNKLISPHKDKQTKRISRFIKVLKSFDKNRSTKKIKSLSSKIKTKKDLFVNIPVQKYATPSAYTAERYSTLNRNKQNLSTISKSSKFSNQKVSLPSISLDIYFPQKTNSSTRTLQSNRFKTQVIQVSSIKLPKIFLNKVEGAPTGNLLQFFRLKPTEKYFSKKQNMRLAQRLLLVEASKDLRKSVHKKFYKQQKSYRSISQSSLNFIQNPSKSAKKRNLYNYSKSKWIS